MKQNVRRDRFAEALAGGLTATAAAKAAGYSKRTAKSIGYNLKQCPDVQERVALLRAEAVERVLTDAGSVLQEIESIALDREVAPRDRLRALDLLGRHLNLWKAEDPKDSKADPTFHLILSLNPSDPQTSEIIDGQIANGSPLLLGDAHPTLKQG